MVDDGNNTSMEQEIKRLREQNNMLREQLSFLLEYMSSLGSEDSLDEIELKGELNDLITGDGKRYTM